MSSSVLAVGRPSGLSPEDRFSHAVSVESETALRSLLFQIVDASCCFQVEPYPDDRWMIWLKEDGYRRVRKWIETGNYPLALHVGVLVSFEIVSVAPYLAGRELTVEELARRFFRHDFDPDDKDCNRIENHQIGLCLEKVNLPIR